MWLVILWFVGNDLPSFFTLLYIDLPTTISLLHSVEWKQLTPPRDIVHVLFAPPGPPDMSIARALPVCYGLPPFLPPCFTKHNPSNLTNTDKMIMSWSGAFMHSHTGCGSFFAAFANSCSLLRLCPTPYSVVQPFSSYMCAPLRFWKPQWQNNHRANLGVR
jgi:hypothetical protein